MDTASGEELAAARAFYTALGMGQIARIPDFWAEGEDKIVAELNAAQGAEVDVAGYYFPSDEAADKAMRPSATLNAIIDGFKA